ncbi:FtsX-like permease family protein [Bythopirellula polymerisocia]|uniref:FtsX-like permease family protein n=1 Tax=Bythopirellula polymerisocia TaxID=2528003 RepID=A0A5C6C9M1_9BACT|nr:FtsX-like permease family protein [Bythopirellula polymerisocia]TWU21290.1 FtsX-like permease family protein [Bythopirellula polymerisocia]
MKTPLAWKNLVHNKVRTSIGVAGVSFAVILIFMQLGFLGGIIHTATQIYDALEFDLMLRSPAYLHLTEARSFPRSRVLQAASLSEVAEARSFYLGLSEWQAPASVPAVESAKTSEAIEEEGDWRAIITMGTDPKDPVFNRQEINDEARKLSDSTFVLVDVKSKSEYGPADDEKFSETDIGVETTLGPHRVRIVGLFELGTGMASNGACLTNPEGYVRACPWQTIDDVNFGLIKLKDPSEAELVRQKLLSIYGIPSRDEKSTFSLTAAALTNTDVEILTRQQALDREEHRWVHETPLGQIFTLGVWVALFVGVAIVYQVLSTDIANMMGEYATLKAMGYGAKYLTKVVLLQAVLLAVVGYIPSIIVSWGLYRLVEKLSGMPMNMTPGIAALVLALAITMCVLSGLAALRKLYQADPADLF